MNKLLYAFYGDDFTGSTDVLEQLALGGIRAALFLETPTPAELAAAPGLQAVGIAGDSRSQTPEWMPAELPRVFAALRDLDAPIVHYKVCSTFDSSPERGSIGRALEIGLDVIGSPYAPIIVGAPHLRRYVWHGMLFAADPAGKVQRIDRHPMSRHPVTPMREATLRLHLASQTSLPIGEARPQGDAAGLRAELEQELARGARAVVFDTFDQQDLNAVGQLLWSEAKQGPVFAIGSSGLTAALIGAWRTSGEIAADAPPLQKHALAKAGSPLLVVSGSCSAATERQLRWALGHGFAGVKVDPALLLDAERGPACFRSTFEAASEALSAKQDVVIYTSLGTPAGVTHGEGLGVILGRLMSELLERHRLPRVMLCGGDTSSHAVQQLGLRALTWRASLQTGAPLCRAQGGIFDGLELVLKGGQVGSDDFFAVVRDASESRDLALTT